MTSPVVVSRIQNRRGTQSQFDALYPPGYTGIGGYGSIIGFNSTNYPNVLQSAELCLCTDSRRIFMGNINGEYEELASGFPFPPLTGNAGKFLETDGTIIQWMTVPTIPSQTGNAGKFLETDGTTATWQTIVGTLPTQTGNAGKFLETNGTFASWTTLPSQFPTQTGNAGKVLETDGTNVSWQTIAGVLPTQTGNASKYLETDGSSASWVAPIYKPAPMTTVNSSSTAYDFGSSLQHNMHWRSTSASAIIVTVQPDSYWSGTDQYWENNFSPSSPGPMPVGGSAIFTKCAAGDITFAAGSGVTINTPGTLLVNVIYAKVTLIKVATDEWDIEGHLS